MCSSAAGGIDHALAHAFCPSNGTCPSSSSAPTSFSLRAALRMLASAVLRDGLERSLYGDKPEDADVGHHTGHKTRAVIAEIENLAKRRVHS